METHAASRPAASHLAMHRYLLAGALLLRAADHGAYAVWLLVRQPGWLDIFAVGSSYALCDGAMGIVVVWLLMPLARTSAGRLLVLMTLVDAVGRIAVGSSLRIFPGIPTFVVTLVSFLEILGAWATVLGIAAMTIWVFLRIRGRGRWTLSSDALFDPLAVVALLSYVVGFVLFVDPPTTSRGLATFAASAACTLAIAFVVTSLGALAHLPHERVRPTATLVP
jgi:hypothetical protein